MFAVSLSYSMHQAAICSHLCRRRAGPRTGHRLLGNSLRDSSSPKTSLPEEPKGLLNPLYTTFLDKEYTLDKEYHPVDSKTENTAQAPRSKPFRLRNLNGDYKGRNSTLYCLPRGILDIRWTQIMILFINNTAVSAQGSRKTANRPYPDVDYLETILFFDTLPFARKPPSRT